MILSLLKCRPALIQIRTSLRLLQRLWGTLRCWGKQPVNPGRSPSIWQIIGFSSGDSCSPGLLAEMYWKKVSTDEKEDKKCWWYEGIQQNKDLQPWEKQFKTTCLEKWAQISSGKCQLPFLLSNEFSALS